MTLEKCSKAQLLTILKTLSEDSAIKRKIHWELDRIELDAEAKRIDEEQKAVDEYLAAQREWLDVMKPFEGTRISEIPDDVIQKARALQRRCEIAEKKMRKITE